MFGSAVLETAIGLVFVYLLLGLILSALTELISSWFQWRSKTLRQALDQLLDAGWAEKLLAHPLVKSLGQPKSDPEAAPPAPDAAAAQPAQAPSYIPARIFTAALLDLVRGPADPSADLQQRVRSVLATVPDVGSAGSVRQQMQSLIDRFPATGRLARELGQVIAAQPGGAAALRQQVSQVLASFAADPGLESLSRGWADLPDDQLEAKAKAILGTVETIGQGKRDLQKLIDFLPSKVSAAEAKAAILRFLECQNLWSLVAVVQQRLAGTTLGRSLSALFHDAEGRLETFEKAVEGWFNDSMDRVSGWYRRKTQLVHVILAVVLAVGLNVDSVVLVKALSSDTSLRQSLVAQAEAVAKNPPQSLQTPQGTEPPQGTEAQETEPTAEQQEAAVAQQRQKLADLRDQLDELGLPVGWVPAGADDPVAKQQKRQFPPFPPSSWGGWLVAWLGIVWFHFFGWVMTAAAASLGAPFWFDVLKKVITIRSNGQPPEAKKAAAT